MIVGYVVSCELWVDKNDENGVRLDDKEVSSQLKTVEYIEMVLAFGDINSLPSEDKTKTEKSLEREIDVISWVNHTEEEEICRSSQY